MKRLSIQRYWPALLALTGVFLTFQNCAPRFKVQDNGSVSVSASSVDSSGSDTSTTTPPASTVLLGQALYASKCASCHLDYATSTLKGRNVTADIISNATTSISAMTSLRGTLTQEQLNSLEDLFKTSTGSTTPTTSSFACASADAQNNNSISMKRLTGPELQKTYRSLVPTAAWTNMASSVYLLPEDKFDGDIAKFKPAYASSQVEQISRFNEELANQIISSSANMTSFFGSCATSTSFAKTCFDSFLTSKGPYIFRSALASDDNSRIWAIVSQATSVSDQMKTAIQLLFNDPRFLYHVEMGEGAANSSGLYALTSYEIANRISYGMTGGPADATLWAAAVANSLKTSSAVATQVDRIALTTAFQDRIVELMKFYIGRESIGGVTTNTDFIAGLNVTNIDVAVTNEFNQFIKYIVFTQKGTLRDLLTSQAAFPQTAALASVMGTSVWTSGNPVTAPNHYGLISRPYFVYNTIPDLKLVQRGRSLRMNMLCTEIPQPSAEDLAGRKDISEQDLLTLTRRDYIDKSTLQAASCIACHSKMNPLGFTTENYDSLGRYSTVEKIYNSSGVRVATQTVPTSTIPQIVETDTRSFANVKEFQTALADTDSMHQCLSRKTFQFFNRQADNLTYDSCNLNKMDTQIKQGQPLLNFFVEGFKQPSMLYKRSN